MAKQVNQIEFYKQFYNSSFDSKKEGLNTLYFDLLETNTEVNVVHLKVALT